MSIERFEMRRVKYFVLAKIYFLQCADVKSACLMPEKFMKPVTITTFINFWALKDIPKKVKCRKYCMTNKSLKVKKYFMKAELVLNNFYFHKAFISSKLSYLLLLNAIKT